MEFIANPRRGPRAPVRCSARVIAAAATFDGHTEDVGSHGCQVISPKLIRKGEPVRVTLSDVRVRERLAVAGRVAWASLEAPFRVGIAFDEAQLRSSKRFVGELLQAYPSLTPPPRVPARIPLDAWVYLAAPPRLVVDFSRAEVSLLRAVASGARIDDLLARFHDCWPATQGALYSLLARRHVTLSRGAAVLPEAWRKLLADLEGTLEVEALAPERPLEPPPLPAWAHPPPTPAAGAAPTPAGPGAGDPGLDPVGSRGDLRHRR